MRAVILAAGTGSRLGELTKTRTKGMVPVKGRKLIDYLFDYIDVDIFDEIIVVGGFAYEDIKNHIDAKGFENVRVIENKQYLKGNIFTLLTALDEFSNDSFLVTNIDHIYPTIMFDKMKESFSGITAMTDQDRKLSHDDMKVKLYKDTISIKKISKQLDDFDRGYIGMSYVDISRESEYRDAAKKAIEKFGENAVVENILQILAEDKNTAPKVCDLSGFGWYEVDTPEDLEIAEKGLEKDPNFN